MYHSSRFSASLKFYRVNLLLIKKSYCNGFIQRAQGGPRGGPLVVPPVLDKNLANHMQSNRNDLIGISMCGTMKS